RFKMESEKEFNEADLCFTSNIEMNIFDEILNTNGQLRAEESNSLMNSEDEGDLTNSEESLYPLNQRAKFQ
ncbi:1675_t:CDS:1, partial [Gigaspora margarita]